MYYRDDETEGEVSNKGGRYKRPKFIVEIKPPAGTYRVNNTVIAAGISKAICRK